MTGGRVGPLEGDLREAIALDRERAPRYAVLSGGLAQDLPPIPLLRAESR